MGRDNHSDEGGTGVPASGSTDRLGTRPGTRFGMGTSASSMMSTGNLRRPSKRLSHDVYMLTVSILSKLSQSKRIRHGCELPIAAGPFRFIRGRYTDENMAKARSQSMHMPYRRPFVLRSQVHCCTSRLQYNTASSTVVVLKFKFSSLSC